MLGRLNRRAVRRHITGVEVRQFTVALHFADCSELVVIPPRGIPPRVYARRLAHQLLDASGNAIVRDEIR